MTQLSDNLNHLNDEHRQLLEEFNQGWTRHEKQPNQVQRHAVVLDVKELYARSGLKTPNVIVCDSIFQLTVYPLLMALMLNEQTNDKTIPYLRKSLKMPPWGRLWENLDGQFGPSDLKRLRVESDKARQKDAQKELNRVIHRIYETEGGTVDTFEAPRLTNIGLQINSNFQASVKSLLSSLKQDMDGQVQDEALAKVTESLARINSMYTRMETQLDLQLLPQILAKTINTFKTLLSSQDSQLSSGTNDAKRSSGSEDKGDESEILPLIRQAKGLEDTSHAGRPMLNGYGTRMGAYRDPAIRLIASGLQVELFRKSRVMQFFPIHFFIRNIDNNAYSTRNLEWLNIWNRLLERAYALLFYESIAFVCEYPILSRLDAEQRFHDENGPALKFSDDFSVYFWRGRRVNRELIESPQTITIEQIEKEKNVDTRSILIERYGLSRFLQDTGAVKVHEDECGVLYRKAFEHGDTLTDEPLMVVMVTNSTPEADGTRKQFFLRVPPNVATAREAVAWTFRMDPDDYEPTKQS